MTSVALFTRAWIEISTAVVNFLDTSVALFTRAWIEIPAIAKRCMTAFVALFTRAWIEIAVSYSDYSSERSPSSRGRGLKF